jgi:hypothetical protein
MYCLLQRGPKVTSLVARCSRGRCAQHLRPDFADVNPITSCKFCALLPREERATRDVKTRSSLEVYNRYWFKLWSSTAAFGNYWTWKLGTDIPISAAKYFPTFRTIKIQRQNVYDEVRAVVCVVKHRRKHEQLSDELNSDLRCLRPAGRISDNQDDRHDSYREPTDNIDQRNKK